MTMTGSDIGRRGFLGAIAGAALLAHARQAGAVPARGDAAEPVRRLLDLAVSKAFATLTRADGFWNSPVARINLPVLFGKPGQPMRGVLAAPAFREQLQHSLNRYAEVGAVRAGPAIAARARRLTIHDHLAILRGEPTAATTLLRASVGPASVNAMIPALRRALRQANDPLIAKAIAALPGVSLGDVAHSLANEADNAIWYAIGSEEAAIRRNPRASGDPSVIAALRMR